MVVDCDPNSAFFGFMGIAIAVVFCNLGGAYGTAKSSMGIFSMGVMRPDLAVRSIIPLVMAGILGIYGLILGFMINQGMSDPASYSAFTGYAHLSAGMTVGLSSLAAGLSIGIAGDASVRANAQQPRLYVTLVLVQIFSEAIALYGVIVGMVVSLQRGTNLCTPYA
eukprot:Trichotokara_eunicae@DN6164_c1_g1_i1.p1